METFHLHFKFLVCCVPSQLCKNVGVMEIYEDFSLIWVPGDTKVPFGYLGERTPGVEDNNYNKIYTHM